MKEPLLIHILHSSIHIPGEDRKEILLSDSEIVAEQLKITDRYTEELYHFTDAIMHRNELSRLILDPERFRKDNDEAMSKFGMGAIYTHTIEGCLMKKLTDTQREVKLKKKNTHLDVLSNVFIPSHS